MILDSSQPIIVGHLSEKIRITALGQGVIDNRIGIAVSIRIVNPKKLVKEDFIRQNTASEEMLDFLSLAHRYGESHLHPVPGFFPDKKQNRFRIPCSVHYGLSV